MAPLLDWSAEPMPTLRELFPSAATTSSHSSLDSLSEHSSTHSFNEAIVRRRGNWPVVRLDNVPWSVTADEVEHWLPDGSLASDVGFSQVFAQSGQTDKVTLAVHILCNRVDGRTLNQAFVECCSLESAKAIVRSRDGTRLLGRPIHVAMSTQSELLATIFPAHAPGFNGIDAVPPEGEAHVPPEGEAHQSLKLVLDAELAGLVELCRQKSPHARKVAERPFYNLVSIVEKLPFHQAEAYDAELVSDLFNACAAAVKILEELKSQVAQWREILTVLMDAVLRCPGFSAGQKKKIVRLAGGFGFIRDVPTKINDVFYNSTSTARHSLAGSIAASILAPADNDLLALCATERPSAGTGRAPLEVEAQINCGASPSISAESSGSSTSDAFLSILAAYQQSAPLDSSAYSPVPSPTYVFPPPPSPRSSTVRKGVIETSNPSPQSSRRRRYSAIAGSLAVDATLVAAVARELENAST